VARVIPRASAIVMALLVSGACREKPSERSIYEAKVAEVVPKIEETIGLKFRTPPKIDVRSKEEVRKFVEQQIEDSLARVQLSAQEAALKEFGLIPDTMSLRDLLVSVLEEQIGGYYDPRTKVLYIVEGTEEEAVGITVTHELIHALQDQYINLDSIMRATGDDDRVAAAQAVFEGQATYEQMRIMFGRELADALPGGWDRVREEIRTNRAKWPVFAAAPLVVQEMLLFPYLSGAEFMRAFRARAGDGATTPFDAMPTSTEQILHPGLYIGDRDEPMTVTLPALRNVTTTHQNTVGEFTTRLFLYEHLRDATGATNGASGWDGDRFALVHTSRGDGLVWVTVWDTQIDAGDFYNLMDRTIDRRYGPAEARPYPGLAAVRGMTAGRAYSVGGRSAGVATGEIGGHPVVVYVDLPMGEDLGVLDLARISLKENTAPPGRP
jgi:hypothetical protein